MAYPKTFLVWANCTSPFTLYRNGTLISNNSEQALTTGVYNFSFQRIDSQNYSLIFNRIAIECEEQDLAIQNRISSLHWVTPTMLEAILNENIPNVHETIYKAINGKDYFFLENKN